MNAYESCNICGVHLSQVDLNLFRGARGHLSRGQHHSRRPATEPYQPAISHALKRLRDLLQDPLFVRQGPHMVPTPFTRNMIEQVRQALQILEVNLSHSRQLRSRGYAAELSPVVVGIRRSPDSSVLAAASDPSRPGNVDYHVRAKREIWRPSWRGGSVDLPSTSP